MKKISLLLMLALFSSSTYASQCKINPAQESGGTAFVQKAKSDLVIYEPKVGMLLAKKEHKPIMAIVASSNCPAWKQFSEMINDKKSETYKILSSKFVVIGVNSYDMASYPHLATDMSPTVFLLNDELEIMADDLKGVPTSEKNLAQWLNEFSKWYKTIN